LRHHKKRAENRLVDTALPKRPGKYSDGKGLWFIVDGGSRSWLFRFKINGRERYMGLGPYPAVTVAEARQRAEQARRDKAAGLDPIEARDGREADKKAQEALDVARRKTFRQSAADYIAANSADWRNQKHAAQWHSSLECYVYPVIGDLPVGEIDRAQVLRVLEQDCGGKTFWTAKPETASRVRGRIQLVLAWAKSRGHRSGDNPASWENLMDALPKLKRERRVKHMAALPYREAGAFMKDLRDQEGIASLAFQFLILNTARTFEVIGARVGEIDKAARLWVIPPERSKNGKEQRKPLADASIAILDQIDVIREPECSYLFPGQDGRGAMSPSAFLNVLKRMKRRKQITPHGMRSTFKDWAIEQTSFPESASELALGHDVGDQVERSYRRGDMLEKRRALAEAWAGYCGQVEGGNVVGFDQAKRAQRAAGE
jgi:integrase